ncbi:MAG TPA: peptidoglycan-binding protein, partial [Candidatus Ventricola intestinavium]|nr:peptidoglycan-binding protein [Candidatus Ventricola intestinavium]
TTTRANLRKSPRGDLIRELEKGIQMTAIGQVERGGELWFHLKAGEENREGYMLAELLRQVRPVVLRPVTEGEVRALFPVLSRDPIADIKAEIPFTYTDEELAAYHTLRVGDRSDEVLSLRRRLYELGYYAKPNENTLYTESTAEVVGFFQEDCGIEATGEADPLTQALLYDERMLAREGSEQEILYLDNDNQPLVIQRAEITSYSFYGSVQVSVRNETGGTLTAFGLKIIPNMSDGSPADMAETFAEEIEREYSLNDISIGRGDSYSDFATNGHVPIGDDIYMEPEIGEEVLEIWPHHFQVSRKIYFSGAQVAVSWYRSGGRNVYVDDDQMAFIPVGRGAQDILMHTLPITVTDQEREEASKWEMGIVSRYVLPIYQEYYGLPQGAWLKSVEDDSPAQDAGLAEGDILVGIGDITILGDATLRRARASIAPGQSASVYFWRDGSYYSTEIIRPEETVSGT